MYRRFPIRSALLFLLVSARLVADNEFFEIDIPFVVNGREHGTISVAIPSVGTIKPRVRTSTLIDALSYYLDPRRLDVRPMLCTMCPWTDLDLLLVSGIDARLDFETLVFEMNIPIEDLPIQILRVRPTSIPSIDSAVAPSRFSAYVNGSGSVELAIGPDDTKVPFSASLAGVLNANGWVADAGVTQIYDGVPQSFRVEPTRIAITKDIISESLRINVGNLVYPLQGYQSYLPLIGISVTKLPILQPFDGGTPLLQTMFTLRETVTASVAINGQTVRTEPLSSGRVALADLGLANGVNLVETILETETGAITRHATIVPFSSRLLPIDESLFSITFGVPTDPLAAPVLSLLQRRGLSTFFTSGIHAEMSVAAQLMGFEGVLASKIGLFDFELGISNTISSGLGVAMGVIYRFKDNRRPRFPSLTIGGDYTARRFGGVANPHPDNSNPFTFSLASGFEIGGIASVAIRVDQKLGFDAAGETDLSASLGSSVVDGASIRLEGGLGLGRDRPTNWLVGISLSSRGSANRRILSFGQGSEDVAPELQINYRPETTLGEVGVSTRLEGWPGGPIEDLRLSTTASLRARRLQAEINQLFSEATSSRTGFRISSALVYADGYLAVSAPVTDSFALFPAMDTAGDLFFGVNPNNDGYATERDFIGPTILSNLASYAAKHFTIDAPELPIGEELKVSSGLFYPPYKSGIVVPVEIVRSVYLGGTAIDSDSLPVALVVAVARMVTEIDEDADGGTAFFTDEEGRFILYGARSGTAYELSFPGFEPIQITTGDESGFIDIGTIILQPREVLF